MAIHIAKLLHLWYVLTLDEQWNGRNFCNSKYIASTQRLQHTIESCITYHTIPFLSPHQNVLPQNQIYVWRENVTTFVMSWYIYGMLIHLQKPMAPVNVTTHHKCINGKKLQYIVWFVTDIHWYQLDINQTSMSCVSISIRYQTVICVKIDVNTPQTCILGTVVVKSIKYHAYTDSPVTTFMVCSNTRWAMKWPKMS